MSLTESFNMPREQAFAVRNLQGAGWQVLLESPLEWHTCCSEQDARFIANGMVLAAAVSRGEQTGEETAQELDEAMSTLVRNVGQCMAERIMKASADRARGKSKR
jgi:hypothetical protein